MTWTSWSLTFLTEKLQRIWRFYNLPCIISLKHSENFKVSLLRVTLRKLQHAKKLHREKAAVFLSLWSERKDFSDKSKFKLKRREPSRLLSAHSLKASIHNGVGVAWTSAKRYKCWMIYKGCWATYAAFQTVLFQWSPCLFQHNNTKPQSAAWLSSPVPKLKKEEKKIFQHQNCSTWSH